MRDDENWNAAVNFSYQDQSYVTHLVRDKSRLAEIRLVSRYLVVCVFAIKACLNWFVFVFFSGFILFMWKFIDSRDATV